MALTIDLTDHDSYWELRIDGELGYDECAGFRMSLDRILASPSCSALVDLTGIAYMDSSALGLMLSFYKKCTGQAGSVVLVTGPVADHLLGITRLNAIFPIAGSREAALVTIADGVPKYGHSSGSGIIDGVAAVEAQRDLR